MKISLNILKSAMNTQVDRQGVVANNLANISTTGFKRDVSFIEFLTGDPASKLVVRTDFAPGRLKQTDNPLDLALVGRGFFAVETDDGEAYTRNGRFTVGEDGVLRTVSGFPVLGLNGPVTLPLEGMRGGGLTVTARGEVLVGGEPAAMLRIVDFESYAGLKKVGADLFKATAGSFPEPAVEPAVRQGNLEESNVDPIGEMVGLIELQRRFESSLRVVRALDGALGRAVNDIGRLS